MHGETGTAADPASHDPQSNRANDLVNDGNDGSELEADPAAVARAEVLSVVAEVQTHTQADPARSATSRNRNAVQLPAEVEAAIAQRLDAYMAEHPLSTEVQAHLHQAMRHVAYQQMHLPQASRPAQELVEQGGAGPAGRTIQVGFAPAHAGAQSQAAEDGFHARGIPDGFVAESQSHSQVIRQDTLDRTKSLLPDSPAFQAQRWLQHVLAMPRGSWSSLQPIPLESAGEQSFTDSDAAEAGDRDAALRLVAVRTYAELNLAVQRSHAVGPYRIWLLARYLDTKGEGKLPLATLNAALCDAEAGMHMTIRQLQNLLAVGEGIFWDRYKVGRESVVKLRGVGRVALYFKLDQLRYRAAYVPVDWLRMGHGAAECALSYRAARRAWSRRAQQRPHQPRDAESHDGPECAGLVGV
ncbi:MAG: hypothetical protein HC853_00365 [Anaerolineae bacterium]|nr:hypothetical protein [Anaerolineae bacterium]